MLQRDPTFSLLIAEDDRPYRAIEVKGIAHLREEGYEQDGRAIVRTLRRSLRPGSQSGRLPARWRCRRADRSEGDARLGLLGCDVRLAELMVAGPVERRRYSNYPLTTPSGVSRVVARARVAEAAMRVTHFEYGVVR